MSRTLMQVDRCTGKTTFLCRIVSVDAGANTCQTCTFAALLIALRIF